MKNRINWGIIGTGTIARTFARGVGVSQTGRLSAVASRSKETAEAFAGEFQIGSAHGSYEAILDDKDIDAVYISTPHPWHAEWAVRACRAGKHVLVEKPIALNHADAMAMIEAAIANNRFLMEAFMYRCHPQTARLIELIKSKAIGDVRMIQATFSFHTAFNPKSRLFDGALGGGGILDVGCYTMSMSRLIAGAALGKDFSDPIEVKGTAHLGQTGVDEWAAASLRFDGGIVGQLATGVSVNQESVVRVFGSEGQITLPNPWVYNRTAPERGRILLQGKGEAAPHEILVEADATSFTYEADVVGNAIPAGQGQAPAPAMTWDDSLGNIRALEAWRESIGLSYKLEQPEGYRKTTIAATKLGRWADHRMIYGSIAGVEKPISRLIMGCDNQRTFAHSAIMFDDFFERGGNTFDTAWIYGGGLQEKLLGQWIRHRGVREQAVIIAKGAHSPHCTPRDLTRQLHESLERLGTDHADIYIMHRDNPEVPVGEFVTVLNDHLLAGRIKTFGGSNWTLARIDEANAWAKQHGLTPFALVSNQFSLAKMLEPIWKGAISAGDEASRAWFTKMQMPLLAWSSQARGFFVEGLAHPDKRDNEEMVRSWYSNENFARLNRAKELARKKNTSSINIALAYVLAQPFPTFALIGPRTLGETRTSFDALDVKLNADEVRWLNSGT